MIGLGGAIGTGLFAGSTLAIGYAGPGVVLSYVLAGLVAAALVLSLSEMAVVHPSAGSIGVYAETYLNPWAGFVVRYTYWVAEVIAVGGEMVACGIYMTYWFPGTPVWMWALGFGAALVLINARSVAHFGTAEYAFSLVKVAAIIVFILLGGAAIFGLGVKPIGLTHLTASPGGLLPHGLGGVWMAMIVGIFSYNGIEVIAVASGETKDPQRAIPAALGGMALRLFLFYVLSMAVIVTVVPWQAMAAKTVTESPFVRVFSYIGVRHAAGIMNFVVLTAALSSMNTNLFLCGRMLFSLSRGGYAPRRLGRLNPQGSPAFAVLLSGVCMLAAAAISKLTPYAYNYLLGVALFAAIIVWMIILASHLAFRARRRGDLPFRTPLFPIPQIFGLGLLAALLVTMGLSPDWNVSWKVGVPWLALLSLAYVLGRRRRAQAASG
ncbi:MAG: amino acid permease [Alphaproteobacteria bacterium]|nr:amino acid permease [Alphaproteobacteria bacterium]